MPTDEITLSIKTVGIDEAIEKAEKLRSLLTEVNELIRSISGATSKAD